jgi:hypothetical protein
MGQTRKGDAPGSTLDGGPVRARDRRAAVHDHVSVELVRRTGLTNWALFAFCSC